MRYFKTIAISYATNFQHIYPASAFVTSDAMPILRYCVLVLADY